MKFAQTAGPVILACAMSAPVAATDIANLDFARSMSGYSDVDAANGFRVSFEHWFDAPVSFAVGYSDSGKADVTSVADTTVNFFGADALVDVSLPLKFAGAGSRLFAGGGVYRGVFRVESGGTPFTEHKTGATFNAGIDWMFSKHVGARLAYQNFVKVKDLAEDKSIGVVQAGLLIAWGGAPAAPAPEMPHEPASASASAPPAEQPLNAPVSQAETDAGAVDGGLRSLTPAPTPAPAPAVAAPPPVAPAGPVAPVLPVGSHAKLRDGTFGRGRPTADSVALAGLESGTSVTLKAYTENIAGAWWYVSAPTTSGWARAQDLDPQP